MGPGNYRPGRAGPGEQHTPSAHEVVGLRVQITTILALPVRLFWRIRVSFESRYGMWPVLLLREVP
jgi:hypothetical protein